VRAILAAGIDPDVRDDERLTPLAAAAIAGSLEVMDLLLADGADLERKAGRRSMTPLLNGESALIWAAFNGCDQVISRLLAAGVPIDFQAHDGNAALADAARRGHVEIVRALLANGASVNLRDKAGATARSQAMDAGFNEIAEILKQHGAVR
jgi:ankyrin repeat protein